MNSVEQLYKQRQELFIERRTTIASEVNKFFDSVKGMDPSLLKDVTPINGNTAEEVLSSMWEEPFDKAHYQAQLDVLNKYIASVKVIADALDAEARRILDAS